MKRTNIEWTDLSANPLKYRDASGQVVWGCVKKSSGCANCYAETIAHHWQRGGPFTRATMEGLTPFLSEEELYHILTAQRIGGKPVAGSKCFLGDMTDVFGDWVSDELLDTLFAAIAMRRDVTFQVLTKRADRMADYFRTPDRKQKIAGRVMDLSNMLARQRQSHTARLKLDEFSAAFAGSGPIRNLWLGVSAENQAAADERIPHLLATPAAVRFLSCEPLLGPLDLSAYLWKASAAGYDWPSGQPAEPTEEARRELHWVIVGGESGPGARPFRVEWARSLVQQCREAGVACFVKQDSGPKPGAQGRIPLEIWQHKEFPHVA
jgi:protein gp37